MTLNLSSRCILGQSMSLGHVRIIDLLRWNDCCRHRTNGSAAKEEKGKKTTFFGDAMFTCVNYIFRAVPAPIGSLQAFPGDSNNKDRGDHVE